MKPPPMHLGSRSVDELLNSSRKAASPLPADFVQHVLGATADSSSSFGKKLRGIWNMKFYHQKISFAAVALALVATGSIGAYALANWFHGNVDVKQDASTFSVDLSSCKGSLPGGVNEDTDRQNVRFKILGSPHVSAEQLQQQLLKQCEFDAVLDFYHRNPATQALSIRAGTIKAIEGQHITFTYTWGNELKDKQLVATSGTTFYSQGQSATLQGLHISDKVVFVTQGPGPNFIEGQDSLAAINEVRSVFKTQYDLNLAPSTGKETQFYSYDKDNIMPLDWYNQLHKK